MNDHAQQDRQALIHNTNEHKIARAKQCLGERYVFHPVNRVQKLPQPLPDPVDGSLILRRKAA